MVHLEIRLAVFEALSWVTQDCASLTEEGLTCAHAEVPESVSLVETYVGERYALIKLVGRA